MALDFSPRRLAEHCRLKYVGSLRAQRLGPFLLRAMLPGLQPALRGTIAQLELKDWVGRTDMRPLPHGRRDSAARYP
jgi:hypothetical protein